MRRTLEHAGDHQAGHTPDMNADDRLETLSALWSAWEKCGRALTDEQWALPTRLEAWDIRALYAHAAGWPYGFSRLVGRVRDVEPTHRSAAALLRELNRPDSPIRRDDARIAAAAREDAARYRSEEMIGQFAEAGPRAIATARRLGPVVVDYSGLAMLPLPEAVSIGIVEATVHLLDLQRALGVEPDVPAPALRHTAAVLVEMVPAVDLIEVATGRSATPTFPVLT
jgi:uncharacterized protein (TIGR03083 family)